MAHRRFEFEMPASAAVAFDAFHYHHWRAQWDSLVRDTRVVGGAPCPCVGAITENSGRGWLGALAMRTRFVSFDRPHIAAATMVGRAFPFERWAASMRHKPLPMGRSVLVYTYSLQVGPRALRWLLEPFVDGVFAWQTRHRFTRMQVFLRRQAPAIERWQQSQRAAATDSSP